MNPKKTYHLLSLILLSGLIFSSHRFLDTVNSNFFDEIVKYDLSTIINPNIVQIGQNDSLEQRFIRDEILGFIGSDYQRFEIHFISIIQNPKNPYEYLAYGKTRVKKSICSFQGTITIRDAFVFESEEIPSFLQGYAICDVVLYEDGKQTSSGFITGSLKSNFMIDDKGKFRYDTVMLGADSFSNNQFTGNWTSYKSNNSKKCNWGDFRIPECGDLDIGAGYFSVNEKYVKNGWENYKLAYLSYPDSPESRNARIKENEKWWE